MAVVYSTTVKTSRMEVVRAAIDGAATPGKLELGTSGFGTLLVSITLADPCGIAAGGILTFTLPLEEDGIATGVAVTARIVNGDDTSIITGLTVGTSGTNVVLNTSTVTMGNPVAITSATITHG